MATVVVFLRLWATLFVSPEDIAHSKESRFFIFFEEYSFFLEEKNGLLAEKFGFRRKKNRKQSLRFSLESLCA